jgi:uncharacterized membrane protein YfcA
MVTLMDQAWAGAAGLVAGALSGLFGVGGNAVLVPLLALALGLPQHEAQGLTLAALLPPLGAPAVWQYYRQGVAIRWGVVGVCMAGFLAGAPVGGLLAQALPGEALRLGFALFLFFAAFRTWRGRGAAPPGPTGELTPLREGWVLIALAGGLAGGFGAGLLGIGGAIVLIPILTGALKLPQREAQLASLVMLLAPLGLPAVLVYARAHEAMPWAALWPVALGFMAGAFLGARLSDRLPVARLERAFALLLVASALGLATDALRSVFS